jgi:hypothetical protein
MVLDFGLNHNNSKDCPSSKSFSISNHKIRAVNRVARKKTRHLSYKDYDDFSSDDVSDSFSDCDCDCDSSVDGNNSNSGKNNNSNMTSYAAVLASHPDQRAASAEVIADHNHNKIVYAADLENTGYEQQQQHQQMSQQVQQQEETAEQESEHFLDSLDEVHTRFILNVPQEELSTSERIFFQLEQAWWYYEDLICDKIEEETGSCPLPRFANLKPFSKRLFEFSPLLRDLDFHKLWKEFSLYKRKISTYGCILLNTECTHVAMCKLYKSNVWTFPAGKINQNEIGIDAAARECYEETGFDPHCLLGGLTKEWLTTGQTQKITWNRPLKDPDDTLAFVEQPSGKRRTCCEYNVDNYPLFACL